MDLRRLEIFVKLMETGSFSRTAKELNLTQPTVSGHIKTLEEEIKQQLFDRHHRKGQPTAAAFVLFDYARKMLDLQQEAVWALDKFKGRISGHLRLGGSTIPAAYLLPDIMSRFRLRHEGARFQFIQDDTAGIVDRVAQDDLELGVVGARIDREFLEYEPLFDDQLILVVPPDHPLAKSTSPLSVSDLVSLDFIMREPGSGTRTAMLEALAVHGLRAGDLHVVAEMGSTEAVRQSVKAGLGASIISSLALKDELSSGQVKAVEVPGLALSRRFYSVCHRRRTKSPLAEAFMDFLRAAAGNTTGV